MRWFVWLSSYFVQDIWSSSKLIIDSSCLSSRSLTFSFSFFGDDYNHYYHKWLLLNSSVTCQQIFLFVYYDGHWWNCWWSWYCHCVVCNLRKYIFIIITSKKILAQDQNICILFKKIQYFAVFQLTLACATLFPESQIDFTMSIARSVIRSSFNTLECI